MWCRIWACDQYCRPLVQKETVNSVRIYLLCVIHWWHGVAGGIPQLERHRRVCTSYHLPIHLAESVHRFKWSMRIIAFILMVILGIMNLVCKVFARTR
jgi:hypothetical protein